MTALTARLIRRSEARCLKNTVTLDTGYNDQDVSNFTKIAGFDV